MKLYPYMAFNRNDGDTSLLSASRFGEMTLFYVLLIAFQSKCVIRDSPALSNQVPAFILRLCNLLRGSQNCCLGVLNSLLVPLSHLFYVTSTQEGSFAQ